MQFVTDAIHAALKHKIDAIVTAPICKESWKLAGFDRWPGHTELLAEKTKAQAVCHDVRSAPTQEVRSQKYKPENEPRTTNHGPRSALPGHKGLRVVLATIHEQLFELRHKFKIGTVFDPIDLAHRALVDWFGIEKPRIAVCGLNPHASENGLFGDEEKRIIEPAIMMARQHGIDATGPFPADTIFIKAVQGHYDLVVAMYHDQGLIPVKLLDFAGQREPHPGPAHRPHQPRPRHRLRHRRQKQSRPRLHEIRHHHGHRNRHPAQQPPDCANPAEHPMNDTDFTQLAIE